jgi:hypothetical protein
MLELITFEKLFENRKKAVPIPEQDQCLKDSVEKSSKITFRNVSTLQLMMLLSLRADRCRG